MAQYVFSAATAMNGHGPWVTEGTAASTTLLKDLSIGATSSEAAAFTVPDDGRVLFRATVQRAGQRPALQRTGRGRAGGGLDDNIPTAGPDADRYVFGAHSGCNLIWVLDGAVRNRIALSGQRCRLSNAQSGGALLLTARSAELASFRAAQLNAIVSA